MLEGRRLAAGAMRYGRRTPAVMACWVLAGWRPRIRVEGLVAERASRRAVLAAAAAAAALPLLAGCKGIEVLGPPPKPGREVDLLDRAIRAEQLLIARYHAALGTPSASGRLAPVLAAVLAEHLAHLRQLQLRLILPPRLVTARPGPSPSPPALPAGSAALQALAAAERGAAARLTGQLLTAPPALAQLLASIAASEAVHAVVLAGAGQR